MTPGGRLAPLDDLAVPDLRAEIRQRAAEPDPMAVLVTASLGAVGGHPRRRPSPVWTAVAVLLVLGAFGAGVAVARRPATTTTAASGAWNVRGRLRILQPFSLQHPLLAASGTGLWLAEPNGTTLLHVTPAGTRLQIDRRLEVAPVEALAADGQHLWILTAEGDLLDLSAGSVPVRVASFGSLGSRHATLSIGGGRIWVGGSAAGGVVAVDVTGARAPVAGVASPMILTGAGSVVWAVDAGGSASMIDPATATVTHEVHVGAAVDAVADGSGLWLTREQDGSLVHLDDRGRLTTVAADVARGVDDTRLASTGTLAWLADAQVLRAFDRSGGPRHTVVVDLGSVDDPDMAGTPGSVWVADNRDHAVTLVAPG